MSILDWWRGRGGSAAGTLDRQRVEETVERVVQMTNPRLRFARRYRARLAPAVESSLVYVRDLVASLPTARDASRAAWSDDPYMRAFFATAADVAQIVSRAPDLRAYFEQNPGLPEAYAVLGMQMTERKVLGMADVGGSTQRDVTQTIVSFGDHRVRVCGRSESELKDELERRLLEQLALEGLASIVADQSRRTALEQERALFKARLQMLGRKGAGMRGAMGGEAVGQEESSRLQSQIEENSRQLGDMGGGAQALDHELENIRAVLADPAQHLFVSSKRLRIDRMNVVIEDDKARAGTELEFLVARIPGTVPALMRAFTLVRFPRAELLSAKHRFDDAARLLV